MSVKISAERLAPPSEPSLVVDLESVPPEGLDVPLNVGLRALAALTAAEGGETPAFITPLTGTLRLRLFEARLEIKGSFKVGVTLACDRCLTLSPVSVAGEFDESLPLSDGPDGELPVVDGRVDLTAFLTESFWLAWPYRFICRPDCAGLCLACGADLNRGPCACGKPAPQAA